MALGDDAFVQDGSGIGNEAAPAGNFPLNQIKSADPKGIRCIFEYYLFFPQPIVHEFLGWSFLSNFSLSKVLQHPPPDSSAATFQGKGKKPKSGGFKLISGKGTG